MDLVQIFQNRNIPVAIFLSILVIFHFSNIKITNGCSHCCIIIFNSFILTISVVGCIFTVRVFNQLYCKGLAIIWMAIILSGRTECFTQSNLCLLNTVIRAVSTIIVEANINLSLRLISQRVTILINSFHHIICAGFTIFVNFRWVIDDIAIFICREQLQSKGTVIIIRCTGFSFIQNSRGHCIRSILYRFIAATAIRGVSSIFTVRTVIQRNYELFTAVWQRIIYRFRAESSTYRYCSISRSIIISADSGTILKSDFYCTARLISQRVTISPHRFDHIVSRRITISAIFMNLRRISDNVAMFIRWEQLQSEGAVNLSIIQNRSRDSIRSIFHFFVGISIAEAARIQWNSKIFIIIGQSIIHWFGTKGITYRNGGISISVVIIRCRTAIGKADINGSCRLICQWITVSIYCLNYVISSSVAVITIFMNLRRITDNVAIFIWREQFQSKGVVIIFRCCRIIIRFIQNRRGYRIWRILHCFIATTAIRSTGSIFAVRTVIQRNDEVLAIVCQNIIHWLSTESSADCYRGIAKGVIITGIRRTVGKRDFNSTTGLLCQRVTISIHSLDDIESRGTAIITVFMNLRWIIDNVAIFIRREQLQSKGTVIIIRSAGFSLIQNSRGHCIRSILHRFIATTAIRCITCIFTVRAVIQRNNEVFTTVWQRIIDRLRTEGCTDCYGSITEGVIITWCRGTIRKADTNGSTRLLCQRITIRIHRFDHIVSRSIAIGTILMDLRRISDNVAIFIRWEQLQSEGTVVIRFIQNSGRHSIRSVFHLFIGIGITETAWVQWDDKIFTAICQRIIHWLCTESTAYSHCRIIEGVIITSCRSTIGKADIHSARWLICQWVTLFIDSFDHIVSRGITIIALFVNLRRVTDNVAIFIWREQFQSKGVVIIFRCCRIIIRFIQNRRGYRIWRILHCFIATTAIRSTGSIFAVRTVIQRNDEVLAIVCQNIIHWLSTESSADCYRGIAKGVIITGIRRTVGKRDFNSTTGLLCQRVTISIHSLDDIESRGTAIITVFMNLRWISNNIAIFICRE